MSVQEMYDQRLLALAKANATRAHRARRKAEVASGLVDARTVLANPDDRDRRMRVDDLLMAIPIVGRAKVAAMFRFAHIRPGTTIEDLTDRQREMLLSLLDYRFGRR